MVSCEQPAETPEMNNTPMIIIEEEPMEVEVMEVLAIDVYQNYVVSGKKVLGINGAELEPVEIKSKEGGVLSPLVFFKKNGKIYFSIQTFEPGENSDDPAIEKILYFSQEGDVLSTIATLPDAPESERVEYESGSFSVKKTSYGELETSTVMRDATPEAYLCIDGAVKTDGGLWFSVPESYSIRLKGVYYWPLEGSKISVMGEGRIY